MGEKPLKTAWIKEDDQMRRILAALIMGGMALTFFSGCVAEETLLKKSNITTDESYVEYLQMKDDQKLDENGEYIVTVRKDPDEWYDGKVCVSFAQNNYLNTAYYTDAALTKAIDPNNCYLAPGESIYAAVAEAKNSNSNLYQFEEYRIYTTTAEGERKLAAVQEQDGQLVYTIPVDFSAGGIQIVPVGRYVTREFRTSIYYTDRFGQKQDVKTTGDWSVNGSKEMKVSSAEPYILRCEYDTSRWFFVSASPKQFTSNPDSVGYVEFYESDPSDAMTDYAVELHPMITVSLITDRESSIRVNDGDAETVKKGKEWTRTNLKYGDFITVETTGKCTIIPSEYQHIQKSVDTINGQKTYKILVTEKLQKTVDPDILKTYLVNLNTDARYGVCTVKVDGKEVKDLTNVLIREDQKLTVSYKLTNSDYKFKNETPLELVTKERTVTIPISMELDGTTINVQRYVSIEKR